VKRYLYLVCFLMLHYPLFASQPIKLGKMINKKLSEMQEHEKTLVIIYLTDKGDSRRFFNSKAQSFVSERSLKRRMKVLPSTSLIDERDFPLEQSYVRAIARQVIQLRHELKWFNAVSAVVTRRQIEQLQQLPFVKEIELVGRWRVNRQVEEVQEEPLFPEKYSPPLGVTLDYGPSFKQLDQINVPAVHNLGIYGQGVVVGVFDNGFRLLTHEAFASMNIIATYDFVDHKESVVPYNPSHGGHGVNTLSTIGGFKPGQLIGPAFKAAYILARTENDSSETPIEEDNWAKAIEWADSIGVDVTSTSLGYLDYDAPYPSWTWADMDGNTTLITRAADRAAQLGIVVVNSAGNDASRGTPNTLIAPADGDSVIAVGAVDSLGNRVSFSSYGPSFDGRTKPDVMAMGYRVWVASSLNPSGYGRANGTSFSCPLAAGVAALLVCAKPSLTPMQVREAMRNTASNAGSPDNFMGWGILNALAAINSVGVDSFAHLSGTVFNDTNDNGIKDSDEPGIEGFVVSLSGEVEDSTTTNARGEYTFSALPVGSYTVSILLPPGYRQTLPDSSYTVTIDSVLSNISRINFGVVPISVTENYTIRKGWNLLSLPLKVENPIVTELYPTAVSRAFIYLKGYVRRDTLTLGQGYWVKYSTDDTVLMTGQRILKDTIDVQQGWNMIGTISDVLPKNTIQQIPDSILASEIFAYDYNWDYADPLLKPHHGYFVKVTQDGKLILNAAAARNIQKNLRVEENRLEKLNVLRIRDADGKTGTLFFGIDEAGNRLQQWFELPPLPPQGVFDARFANNSLVWIPANKFGKEQMNVLLKDVVYPIEVSIEMKQHDGNVWLLREEKSRIITSELRNGMKFLLNNASALRLEYSSQSLTEEVPKVFALENNYPNPFNPITEIRYQTPEVIFVTLKVFNVLGEEIATLVNEVKQAGKHTVEFDATNYPSGVYYYRMSAGGFVQTKKLIVMR
jgi:serine protease AprX